MSTEGDISWTDLVIGTCYKSSFAYMKRSVDDEDLGELVSRPAQEEKVDESNPDAQWGRGSYTVWSADFKKNGVTQRRYQTQDPSGGKSLGFYFKEIPCAATASPAATASTASTAATAKKGGRRRSKKASRRRRYTRRR